jgi:hypothetical protein
MIAKFLCVGANDGTETAGLARLHGERPGRAR